MYNKKLWIMNDICKYLWQIFHYILIGSIWNEIHSGTYHFYFKQWQFQRVLSSFFITMLQSNEDLYVTYELKSRNTLERRKMKSWENICTKMKGKRGKDKKEGKKEKKGRKFRSENAFLHWRYFIFLKPPLGDLFVSRASSHVILSVIEEIKRTTKRFRRKRKRRKREQNMERYIFANFPIEATCVNEQNIPC